MYVIMFNLLECIFESPPSQFIRLPVTIHELVHSSYITLLTHDTAIMYLKRGASICSGSTNEDGFNYHQTSLPLCSTLVLQCSHQNCFADSYCPT